MVLKSWSASIDLIPENPNFIYAILRNKRRFEALRNFTLESGQEELERRNRRRKEGVPMDSLENISRTNSIDSVRSPTVSQRQPTLSGVPEEEATFAIGDDDDDETDDDQNPTPAQSERSSPIERAASRAASVSSSIDDAVPVQLRGMSEKARGKMPAGKPTFSRQNSTTSLGSYGTSPYPADGAFQPTAQWIESWLPELPLHTIMTLTQQLEKHLASQNNSFTTTENAAPPTLLQTIQKAQIRGIDPSIIRVHSFEWSPLSLGWYESLLWGFVFTSEMQVAKGTVGVWNGTAIRLFRVQETQAEGPTLTSPRGAVDAVGSNIVSRIGNINLRGVQSTLAGGAAAGRTSQEANGGGGTGTGTGTGPRGRPTVRTV